VILRNRLGLRGRLIAALILTSALTLAVVAAALLVPLDRRLRADAVRSLTATTLAARPTLDQIPARDVRPGARALRDAVEDIRRRTGDEVAAVDAHGRVLAATEPAAGEVYPDAGRALRTDRVVAGTQRSAEGLEARVAVPVRIRERPYALSMRRPLSSLASATAVVGRGFAFAAGVTLAIAVLVGTWVAARLVRRLDALRADVLRLDDDDTPPAKDDGRDEVGDLARAFAAMRRRVAEQEQARRTFVATASHELRTPLASLRLMLGLLAEDLREEEPDIADARGQVERATAQSDRLARLAADLLDLSRLDAVVALREEPVEMGGLARSVIAEFDGVELHAGEDLGAWALGDPGAVARIVRILLDNARRFAPDGTLVDVALSNGGARCELAVRDEGPGVAAEDRERIFERFERGSGPDNDGGFGLGLAIARELALRMGGDVRLDADAPGARFVLELPAAHTAALAPAIPPAA
jgi:signal transduction histidine kinase